MQPRKTSISALFKIALGIAPFLGIVSVPFSLISPVPRSLAQTQDARKLEADNLVKQGFQQYQVSQFEAALQSWQRALALYREVKDRQGEGDVLLMLGNAYRSLGNYDQAIISYQGSLTIAREIKDRQVEGAVLGNLGNVYQALGDYSQAIAHHQQSLNIAREIKNRPGETAALGNLGSAYQSVGDYGKAIESYQQSLVIVRETKDRLVEGQVLGSIGNAYTAVADYDKAADYYQRTLSIAREIENPLLQRQSMGSLGTIYRILGDYSRASDFHQQSLAIARVIKDPLGEASDLGELGDVYQVQGNYSKAIDYHQQSLAIARKIKDRPGESWSLMSLGNAYQSLEDFGRAIDYYRQSLAITQEIKDRPREGEVLNNLGVALMRAGSLVEAEGTLFSAVRVWESLRASLGTSDAAKVSIFENQAITYNTLQQVLIAQKKTNEALKIAERGRARAFVELLERRLSPRAAVQLKGPASIEIQEIQRIAQVQDATLVQYSVTKQNFKTEGREQALESELYVWVIKPTGEITFRQVNLKPLWQQQNTSLAAMVPQVRKSLGITRGGSTTQVAFKPGDRIRLKRDLPNTEPWEVISVNVQTETLTVRHPSWGSTERTKDVPITEVAPDSISLQKLHQILIEPIADLLPTNPNQRVIFIPQGELFLVPFPALQDANDKYLIEKHTILTAPSIQVLDLTRQQRQRLSNSAKEVLVVGNPKPMPENFSALPFAEEEAKAVAKVFKTQPIIREQATEAAVVAQLPQARLIHLATHGIFDDIRGLGSAIAFARSGQDTGMLTAEEILNRFENNRLNAELVVLSGCETGRGRITGDGVIGLSRSLISAGAPSVIVSLWNVNDESTSELMTEFYQQLQNNTDKAGALRNAMLKTMAKYREPYYWAAFTLIGEAK